MRQHHEELIAAPIVVAGVLWIWTKIRTSSRGDR